MGRSTDVSRKLELRVMRQNLEAEIEDIRILREEFQRERAKITARENKARSIVRDRRIYFEFKEEIKAQGPGISLVSDLRQWSVILDCQADCEAFLEGLSEENAA